MPESIRPDRDPDGVLELRGRFGLNDFLGLAHSPKLIILWNTSCIQVLAVLPTEGKKFTDKSNRDTDDPLSWVVGNHQKNQPCQTCERNARAHVPVNYQVKDPNDEVHDSSPFFRLPPSA